MSLSLAGLCLLEHFIAQNFWRTWASTVCDGYSDQEESAWHVFGAKGSMMWQFHWQEIRLNKEHAGGHQILLKACLWPHRPQADFEPRLGISASKSWPNICDGGFVEACRILEICLIFPPHQSASICATPQLTEGCLLHCSCSILLAVFVSVARSGFPAPS